MLEFNPYPTVAHIDHVRSHHNLLACAGDHVITAVSGDAYYRVS